MLRSIDNFDACATNAAVQYGSKVNAMVDRQARFAWYELLTTDMAAAKAFYRDVVGWDAQDASTVTITYSLLTAPLRDLCYVIQARAEQLQGSAEQPAQ